MPQEGLPSTCWVQSDMLQDTKVKAITMKFCLQEMQMSQEVPTPSYTPA
jgi:hypothetical protein